MRGALAILGGGGHGRSVADCALACGWSEVAIFDDDVSLSTTGPWPITGTIDDLFGQHRDYGGVVGGIGANERRMAFHRRLVEINARIETLVHPAAWVSPHARLGLGTVVLAGGVVNVCAQLGAALIVNTGATVDHDCVLADGVHIAPGAHLAGGVVVGCESWIGAGAVIREYVTIGNRAFIGAGSVVVKAVADGQTVVGNPARKLER